MAFTHEQTQAIKKDGANILVSAAAGSGKTTVLVARIIDKIVNKKIDIDKLLVVTFTNAAASEMKERLLKALYEEIEKSPDDVHLQKQINLINQAHISTISSFCLDVIRNNFFEIGMSANFRVGDETEVEIIKQEAIEEVFENKYEEGNKEFLELLDLYTTYKDDQPLKSIILNLFDFISSIPNPRKWVEDAVEDYNIETSDFAETKWGKIIMDRTASIVNDSILSLNTAKDMLYGIPNLDDCYEIIKSDIEQFEAIKLGSWDEAYEGVNKVDLADWSRKRKYADGEKEIKNAAKAIRDEVEKTFEKKVQKLFAYSSKEATEDVCEMYETLKKIKALLYDFEDEFTKRKREKNIVDFSDIEHLALKLLVSSDGEKTDVAKQYDFDEILIDEYQDSNLVQESILNAISKGNNTFMVGDVKQSVYRFRQARPDLFIDKYEKYKLIDKEAESLSESTKIQLYKNFRSRQDVLDITNAVFQSIMSKDLGEIEYEEDEYLNYAASFEEAKIKCKPEMYIIETKDKPEEGAWKEEEKEEETEILDNAVLEARMAVRKIQELHEKGIGYKDIAILHRSPNNVAAIYEKELIEADIPVFTDVGAEYLESIEVDTIISLLKIIDNPLQDIPLVTVLRSPIGGFDDNELIEIRLCQKDGNYYHALKAAAEGDGELAKKVEKFIELIESFKRQENSIPLDELIWKIYSDTGYYHYVRLMPNGKLRQANLRKLFEKAKDYEQISFKGLFNFITFIEKVASKKSSSLSAAKIIGENDDVVRIMSIHKSKGLEFPVVILCGVEKKFNEQDMRERIIYDQDLGIGMNYIKDRVEYTTLTKDAINIKARKEAVSEEMRVLYVALTRAKEKLVIIGADKDAEKKLAQKKDEIDKYHGKERPRKINPDLVGKYNRYIDWLELVHEYNSGLNLDIEFVHKDEFKSEKKEEEEYKLELDSEIDDEKYKKIDKLLNWQYNYSVAIEAPSKTSVTALKNCKLEFRGNEIVLLEDNIKNKELSLANLDLDEEERAEALTPAEKGTLIHLVLQKLDSNNIDETIESLNVGEEEKAFLKSSKDVIERYVESKLFEELKKAKAIYKETPFYINIKYKNTDENILVQGVIDLYYENEQGELVLVDYKTDRKVDEQILRDRYYNQLEIYKIAIQKVAHKNVKKCCIYSTFLNKLFEI